MLRYILASLLGAAFLSAPAHAGWAVKAIKYKNNGAYTAYFNVEVRKNNSTHECQGANTRGKGVKAGKSLTIRLDNSDGSIKDDPEDSCLPNPGNEVWGMVYIDRGAGYNETSNRKGCRKDKNKFYYDPNGGTLVVETRGTTENGNRCRLVKKGGVEYGD